MESVQGKAAQAYADIERMIVFQELDPGSLVSEALLMEQTGLGRTPVREALQQLSRNRMVEIHPNKGVLIPPNSVEAELRMLQLRRVLDALAVRLACAQATPRERKEIQAMAGQLATAHFDLRTYAETVRATHDLIARSSHNEYVADALAPLQGLSRRFWYSRVVDEQAEIATGAQLHGALLQAVLARDVEAAEAASHALHDYLVEFACAALTRSAGRA